MKATKSGNFKPTVLPEPQTTVARCYSMIDIGTIPNNYMGKIEGTVHKIFITWELPKLKAVFSEEKGPEPFVLSDEFTLSTKDNSNLAKLVSAWRNKAFTPAEENEFDPSVMVGKTALVQFLHKRKGKFASVAIDQATNENTNIKMKSIMKRPADMEAPAQINPSFIWDWEVVEKEGFKVSEWEKIPNFIKDKMKESEEFKQFAPADLGGDTNSGSSNAGTTHGSEDEPKVTDNDW